MSEHDGHGDEKENPILELFGFGHAAGELHDVRHATKDFDTFWGSTGGLRGNEANELEHGLEGAGASHWLAPLAVVSGINSLVNGHGMERVQGLLETFSGGVGTVGLTGAGLTSLGATGIGGELAAGAAAAGPLAALAGAAAAGIAIGNKGNNAAAEHGWLGKREDGTNRNWSQGGADVVRSINESVAESTGSETLGNIASDMSFAPVALGASVGAVASATSVADIVGLKQDQQEADERRETAERARANQQTEELYQQQLAAGVPPEVAMSMVGPINPAWKQKKDADRSTEKVYDAQVKAGMSAKQAETLGGLANPEWAAQHKVNGTSQSMYDSQVKAGMSPDQAELMVHMMNPSWNRPGKRSNASQGAAAEPSEPFTCYSEYTNQSGISDETIDKIGVGDLGSFKRKPQTVCVADDPASPYAD